MKNQLQKQESRAVAPGSLTDVAQKTGQSLAEVFLECEAVVVVDTSGSMAAMDNRTVSRYTAACQELKRLQAETPGKLAVVSFSDHAQFDPSGVPTDLGSSTGMHKALSFIKIADGTGIRIVLISDGEPDNPAETLRIARTFTSRIDTIFIGREGDDGARFLRELSEATGGIAATQHTHELNKLGATVRLMLGGAK